MELILSIIWSVVVLTLAFTHYAFIEKRPENKFASRDPKTVAAIHSCILLWPATFTMITLAWLLGMFYNKVAELKE